MRATWGGQCFRVVVYRTHVAHETAKNFQLDLFDPSDGHYEYSAVVTNKTLGGPALWAFMAGRGIHACPSRAQGAPRPPGFPRPSLAVAGTVC